MSEQCDGLGSLMLAVANATQVGRRHAQSPEWLCQTNVEDLLFERGIDVFHETVRQWWNRFGLLFAGDIRRQRRTQCGASVTGGGISTRCT